MWTTIRAVPSAGLTVVLTVVALLASGGTASAQEAPAVSAVTAAQAAYAEAGADVIKATTLVQSLHDERDALDAERASLSDEQRALAEHQQGAEALARRYMVQAYITGNNVELDQTPLNPDSSGDALYRTYLVQDHSGRTREIAHELVESRRHTDAHVAQLVEALDRNERETTQAEHDLNLAQQRWQIADLHLRAADHDAELALLVGIDTSSPGFVGAGSDGGPTPEESGNAAGIGWARLRQCESGGNYAAVSPSGQYRGAYQFDVTTWHGMGGAGDPATAPPAEQDYRAQLLYNQRGAQPWPVCGQHLLADSAVKAVTAVPPPPGLKPRPASAVPPLPTNDPVPVPVTTSPSTTQAPASTTSTTSSSTTTSTAPPTTPAPTTSSTTTTTPRDP